VAADRTAHGALGGTAAQTDPTRWRPMEFQDRILRCVDCATEFIWTAGEQQFYADKNFKNEPKRCKACKGKRAARPVASPVGVRERVETVTTCSACGKETTVPFRPTQGRPVFCKECFQSRKFAGAGSL
jgi:CxxC-x17-CxxC domain-containing protein